MLLWKHVNVRDEHRELVLAFLLESWRPETPFAILAITGEQGSGKSSTHSRLRQLVDPNSIPLRVAPKSVQDIYVSAANNWVASFENMSNLNSKMQDALCTLATGGGFAARKLYSDADESVIEVKRPIIINGISETATRPDLLDRVIHLELQKIDKYARSAVLDDAFEQDRPAILAGMLDVFSSALRFLPGIHIESPPRMADLAFLGEAISQALGERGSFTIAYRQNRARSLGRSIEASPTALAILAMVDDVAAWTGTVSQLKRFLESNYQQDAEGWPRSPKGLADILRRMTPAFRELGVEVRFLGHRRDGSYVHIFSSSENVHEQPSQPSHSNENPFEGDRVRVVTDVLEENESLESETMSQKTPSVKELTI